MKNALIIITAILLYIPLFCIYFAGVTCFMWLPIVFNHWSGIILGGVITVGTEIIRDKFICD